MPDDIIRTFRAFLEFCYLVRHDMHTEHSVAQVQDALICFHRYWVIFESTGVRPDGFSLLWQHSLVHYPKLIRMFGAPNRLCSSMTKAKHIKAVKEPWRRSSRYEPLGQMLLTNQRLDKLAAAGLPFSATTTIAARHSPATVVVRSRIDYNTHSKLCFHLIHTTPKPTIATRLYPHAKTPHQRGRRWRRVAQIRSPSDDQIGHLSYSQQ